MGAPLPLAERWTTRKNLGQITCPSCVLVIIDMGSMRFWSGRRDPVPPIEEFTDPKTRARVASSADYVVAGRDAAAVARMADFQNGLFVYDLPSDGMEKVAATVAQLASEHGLYAHLKREARRIPHRERAQRVADLGGEAQRRVQQVRSWFGSDSLTGRLALELRAHSHFYRVTEQVRAGAHEVGTLQLDGATLLGLSTSWGDGIFPIWVDRDKAGAAVAVRLELGSEKRRQLMEQVWARAAAGGQ